MPLSAFKPVLSNSFSAMVRTKTMFVVVSASVLRLRSRLPNKRGFALQNILPQKEQTKLSSIRPYRLARNTIANNFAIFVAGNSWSYLSAVKMVCREGLWFEDVGSRSRTVACGRDGLWSVPPNHINCTTRLCPPQPELPPRAVLLSQGTGRAFSDAVGSLKGKQRPLSVVFVVFVLCVCSTKKLRRDKLEKRGRAQLKLNIYQAQPRKRGDRHRFD